MAIGAVGGGTPVVAPQQAAATAPAADAGAAGGGATEAEIQQNLMAGMVQNFGMDAMQESQKIEQQNQARNKQLLAEAKKEG